MKVFADFPTSLLEIIKSTDPTTVTQHGLYIRALGDAPEPNALETDASQASTPETDTTDASATRGLQNGPEGPKQTPPPSAQTQALKVKAGTEQQLHQSAHHHQTGQPSQHPTQGSQGLSESQRQESDASQGQVSGPGCRGVWGRGRVTLLGDAAHATIPNGMLHL